jgi:hypothetical protein
MSMLKMAVFWDVPPCRVMMEAVSSSETSVSIYQTTQKTAIFILVAVRTSNLTSVRIVLYLYLCKGMSQCQVPVINIKLACVSLEKLILFASYPEVSSSTYWIQQLIKICYHESKCLSFTALETI